jgi:hypothetical protein
MAANPPMGDFDVAISQSGTARSWLGPARNRSNRAAAGACHARDFRRGHRLPELVVKCRQGGFHESQRAVAVRNETPAAILQSDANSQSPDGLLSESLSERRTTRHCEEQGDEAIHLATQRKMDCFAESVIGRAFAHSRDPLARNDGRSKAARSRANRYSETVCTTLLTGRALATGSFMSLTSISSYSGKVASGVLAFICTTL